MKINMLLTMVVALAFASMAGAQTKIFGSASCAKPDVAQSAEIGDHPGHAFQLAQGTCTWTKPMEVAGVQDKDYVGTSVSEARGEKVRDHGYVVDTMASGDKAFIRTSGTGTMKAGVPATFQGTWTYVTGTGKLRGIKGGGTYTGTGNADGTSTVQVEGEYTLAAPKAQKSAHH